MQSSILDLLLGTWSRFLFSEHRGCRAAAPLSLGMVLFQMLDKNDDQFNFQVSLPPHFCFSLQTRSLQ